MLERRRALHEVLVVRSRRTRSSRSTTDLGVGASAFGTGSGSLNGLRIKRAGRKRLDVDAAAAAAEPNPRGTARPDAVRANMPAPPALSLHCPCASAGPCQACPWSPPFVEQLGASPPRRTAPEYTSGMGGGFIDSTGGGRCRRAQHRPVSVRGPWNGRCVRAVLKQRDSCELLSPSLAGSQVVGRINARDGGARSAMPHSNASTQPQATPERGVYRIEYTPLHRRAPVERRAQLLYRFAGTAFICNSRVLRRTRTPHRV